MASLRRESGEHFCGGGIISPYHVLTKEEPKFLGAYVVVGSVSINSGGSKHNIYGIDYPLSFVKEIWMHKIRKPVKEKIVESENVSILALPHSEVPVNTEVGITGWGDVQRHNSNETEIGPDKLKLLAVKIIRNRECDFYYYCTRRKRQLCVAHLRKSGENINTGDSGGPLVYNGVVIGVAVLAYLFETENPAIYTKVLDYMGYIKNIMKPAADRNQAKHHIRRFVRSNYKKKA